MCAKSTPVRVAGNERQYRADVGYGGRALSPRRFSREGRVLFLCWSGLGSGVYPLEVGGEDFKLDLLFYHLKLRCFVVIDLKIGPFKPEYAGKMNFYLAAIDDLLQHKDDQPSIGIILCKSKNAFIPEYALRDTTRPIGVSEYRITTRLPRNLRRNLPTTKELETELQKDKPKI
jgi:hypothetical protein